MFQDSSVWTSHIQEMEQEESQAEGIHFQHPQHIFTGLGKLALVEEELSWDSCPSSDQRIRVHEFLGNIVIVGLQ